MSTIDKVPTGDGDIESSFWAEFGDGTTFYECVDDPVGSPDVADCIQHAVSQTQDKYVLFTFSGFGVPAGSTISNVNVTVYSYGWGDATTHYVRGALKVYGTRYYSSYSGGLGGSYRTSVFTWTTNPRRSATWQVDDVNGSGSYALQQFGITQYANYAQKFEAYQVYATVTYTEGAGYAGGGAGGATGEKQSVSFGMGAA